MEISPEDEQLAIYNENQKASLLHSREKDSLFIEMPFLFITLLTI